MIEVTHRSPLLGWLGNLTGCGQTAHLYDQYDEGLKKYFLIYLLLLCENIFLTSDFSAVDSPTTDNRIHSSTDFSVGGSHQRKNNDAIKRRTPTPTLRSGWGKLSLVEGRFLKWF